MATQAGRSQAGRPVTSLSPKEGGSLVASLASQAGTLLPSGEGSTPAITQAFPSSPGDGASSQAGSEVTTHTLLGKVLPKQVTPSSQVRQAVALLGQAGKIPGPQPGKRLSRLPGETALPPRQAVLVPGKAIPHLIPLIGFLKGHPQKILTLRGSLTFPTNL